MKKIIISLLMAAVTAAALTGCKEAGDIEDSSYVLAMGIEKTENGYLIDTHTAVAANVMEQYRKATGDKTVTVFVSTASPYKFCDHVLRAIGETPAGDGVELLDQLHETTGTAIPRRLAALKGKARRFDLTCEKPGMDSVVLDFLK